MIRIFSLIFALCFTSIFAQAASQHSSIFRDVRPASIKYIQPQEPVIRANSYRLVQVDISLLRETLSAAPQKIVKKIIELPHPDGSMHTYFLKENNTMHPDLAVQFPEIKTYDGEAADNSGDFVKLDLTPLGFHAMILRPGKNTIFIDPYFKNDDQYAIVYLRKNFIGQNKFRCQVSGQNHFFRRQSSSFANFNSCELRTYRLALAATAQYTQFFGGTKENALAAQVTTMNRVNGIYQRDFAVVLQIIPNNSQIIYTNPLDQPYTSGNTDQMYIENQINLDEVIGSANYDIGHVFDANAKSSGLAALRSVCDAGNKARGVTGNKAPIGDPFDVDYVAHEMGHQFGADHTQNNACNRNDLTAVEPGSGSTIMGYAGICAPNVQNHSDAYFHGISLQEIGNFLNGAGNVCAVKKSISPAPVVSPPSTITIPGNTPFFLTAQATGSSLDHFSYTWEQMDNEITVQPPLSTAVGGPNFRSVSPSLNNTRYLPNLTALANQGPYTWEVLSTVDRTMNFRITVRQNQVGPSCNAYQDLSLTVASEIGPFEITRPQPNESPWIVGTKRQVNWTVAHTNELPVNATTVDIALSTDGGKTYPILLASRVPNNGSALVTVPNLNTQTARIMVRASDKNFFNVSQSNTTLIGGPPSFRLVAAARNPLRNTSAYVYVEGVDNLNINNYIVQGLPGARVSYEADKHRFVITPILTPRAISISITATRFGLSTRSNEIVIPGIL